MPSAVDFRQQLRRQLRQARRHLSDAEQLNAAASLIQPFLALPSLITKPQCIALYLSNDGEISPHLLCDTLWALGHDLYLPVVEDDQSLRFARFTKQHLQNDSAWQENRFGIKEPLDTAPKRGEQMDIVVLPLVGFDDQGGRLGMGGGFYDRTFEKKKTASIPLLIGLAHDCQQVASLPTQSWDVPLDIIMTPSQVIHVPINHSLSED